LSLKNNWFEFKISRKLAIHLRASYRIFLIYDKEDLKDANI
jgi:hypothetical protein